MTKTEIERWRQEAVAAGDKDQVALCDRALQGDEDAIARCAGEIEKAIALGDYSDRPPA